MIEYEYSKVGQKVYYKELDNGLKVYLIPNSFKSSYYVSIGTLFGSSDIEFIPYNQKEFVNYPNGIAHFLEHKMFEVKNKEDPFSFFLRTGTNSNAGTNFYSTRYYIWGNKDLNGNLDYLLDLVYEPYFTDRNVLKEKGIIKEEIKMYNDDPAWILDDTMRYNLFNNLPIKNKIAGTLESIDDINTTDLYDCYHTFYQPSNMVLVVSGQFEMDEVIKIINHNKTLNEARTKVPIIRKEYLEKDEVNIEYQKIKANIIKPKMRYTFKINKNNFSYKDPITLNMYLNCAFSILFGTTSEFYEKVKKEGISTSYYTDHSYYGNFYTLEIESESDVPDVFKDYVDTCLENIIIQERDFERVKKVWIASEIRLSDNIDMLSDSVFDDIIRYSRPYFNRIDLIRSLNKQTLDKILKELKLEHKSFILMVPKD